VQIKLVSKGEYSAGIEYLMKK